jgi:hypothetical protein
MAGTTSHFRLRRTNAYNAKVPPSPLLSALNINITYFMVVMRVMVHKTQERAPIINSSVITRLVIMELKT